MFKDLKKTIKAVQQGFGSPRVLVVGDLLLNQYCWGQVERISPEAPVPVVHLQHEVRTPGGAGNVACNLAKLGCEVALAGIVGNDTSQGELLKALRETDIDTSDVLVVVGRSTAVKTRVMGGHQQILHIDADDPSAISQIDCDRLLDALIPKIKHYSALILSDYGKGVLSNDVCRRLISEAHSCSIPIFVDPQGRDYQKYAGVTMLTPNRAEIALATGSASDDLEYLLEKAEALRSTLKVDFIALTLGELGMVVLEAGSIYRCTAQAQQVFDVSGAGDTVIATLTAAFVAGLDRRDCANLANAAAGIVIGKVGTVAVSRYELLANLPQEGLNGSTNKICTREQLQEKVARWRAKGERVVFTNGYFDVLHVGHVTLLQCGRQEGEHLIVGLNSDESVDRKVANCPVVGELERAQLLASMSMVDAVVIFDEETPLELIRALRPDVLVKGANYGEEEVVGAAEVRSWGGRVALIPLVDAALSSY
jgi:D-beta-D-heptose 7-phosphate kinase / D-beta-D-heptose 1-phosphate adenosyltransferase